MDSSQEGQTTASTPFNNIFKERLLTLAKALEAEKLPGTDRFSFSWLYEPDFGCGTSGCAIGQCPALFPDQWQHNPQCRTDIIGTDGLHWRGKAKSFFGLSDEEVSLLFNSYLWYGRKSMCGITNLPEGATAADVAANIRKFVAWKEANP